MKILLADEQQDVRSALKLLLELEAGIVIENEASNVVDLLNLIQTDCPDLLLYDWDLPGSNSPSFVRGLKDKYANLTIIVLSSNPEIQNIALNAGADGFISKGSSPLEVITKVTGYILLKHSYQEERS